MRKSDILFFSIIYSVVFITLIFMVFNLNISVLHLDFFWVLLLPIAFSKVVFPNSKFSIWLESPARMPKFLKKKKDA